MEFKTFFFIIVGKIRKNRKVRAKMLLQQGIGMKKV